MGWGFPVLLAVLLAQLSAGFPDGAEVQGNRTEPDGLQFSKRFWSVEAVEVN